MGRNRKKKGRETIDRHMGVISTKQHDYWEELHEEEKIKKK
jgi:hypothetical protein